MRRIVIQSVILGLCLSGASMSIVNAKRKAPASVQPVDHAGIRYAVDPWATENGARIKGGVVTARNLETNALIWTLTVYVVDQKPGLESDVQDVFVKSLSIDAAKNRLIIQNEKNHTYWLDIDKRVSVHVL